MTFVPDSSPERIEEIRRKRTGGHWEVLMLLAAYDALRAELQQERERREHAEAIQGRRADIADRQRGTAESLLLADGLLQRCYECRGLATAWIDVGPVGYCHYCDDHAPPDAKQLPYADALREWDAGRDSFESAKLTTGEFNEP